MENGRMEYGVVGPGRMGGNLTRQALEKGIGVVGLTRHGLGGHPYGSDEAVVHEWRGGRIGGFLPERVPGRVPEQW